MEKNREFLSKSDIVLYLLLNSYFLDTCQRYPERTYKDNFVQTLSELNNNLYGFIPSASKDNYDKMIKVVSLLRSIEAFSLIKDESFDYLDASTIEIPERWFKNKKDWKAFSHKKVIKYIRDALSHNNINELYKISNDGESIEINMRGTKPMPLNIVISKEDMDTLTKYVALSANTYSATGIQIDNNINYIDPNDLSTFFDRFSFVRLYYPNKVSDNNFSVYYRAAIHRLHSKANQEVLLKKAKEYNAEQREYNPTKRQKQEMLKKFKSIAHRTDILSDRKQLLNFIIYYFRVILPIGIYKGVFNQNENVLLYENFMSNWNNSNSDYDKYMQNLVNDYMNNYGKKQKDNLLYDAFGDNTDVINTNLLYLSDYEARKMMNLALLASYYFRSIDNRETFKIKDKEIPLNKIRNAFAHGRWGIGLNETFHLYDWPGGLKNELNYDWEESIKIEDLLSSISIDLLVSIPTKGMIFEKKTNSIR